MPHKIYLVEDHPVMRDAYARLLAREPDFEMCGVAESAEEALCAPTLPGCDLLVTDILLPGMDGIALAAHLRAERPALPVVVISVDREPATAARAQAAGARAYLSKDTLADTLAITLREVLRDVEIGARA
ncbi:MAG TPA: response regulator transcription factor [Rubricoccaceae bacterium]|jgi:DNA-binding NarL/FixJ family response regulator